jgi:hypothetical protein
LVGKPERKKPLEYPPLLQLLPFFANWELHAPESAEFKHDQETKRKECKMY